jgi:exosortase/archaeosortase family protein
MATNKQWIYFVLKFGVLYMILYAANHIATGILIPGGYYNEWAAQHLNYVDALRTLILNGGLLFANVLGYSGHTEGHYLHLANGRSVRMVYSCIGVSVLCFWWAFVISFPQRVKQKLVYMLVGTALIVVLNMMRVGGLAMIRAVGGLKDMNIDHHLIFNIVVYGVIFLLVMQMIRHSMRGIKTGKYK